jgi:hypothetical protein
MISKGVSNQRIVKYSIRSIQIADSWQIRLRPVYPASMAKYAMGWAPSSSRAKSYALLGREPGPKPWF